MIGLTPRERDLALAAGDPATGLGLALAELSLYWDNHHAGAPAVHELRINIRIADEGTPEDRIGAVQAVADWLGVEKHVLHGCHIAQRKFGTGADSVTVEAHYTPDPARAHFERLAAKEAAQDPREDQRERQAVAA